MAALRDGFEPFIGINLNALLQNKIFITSNALYNTDWQLFYAICLQRTLYKINCKRHDLHQFKIRPITDVVDNICIQTNDLKKKMTMMMNKNHNQTFQSWKSTSEKLRMNILIESNEPLTILLLKFTFHIEMPKTRSIKGPSTNEDSSFPLCSSI